MPDAPHKVRTLHALGCSLVLGHQGALLVLLLNVGCILYRLRV
jgi:hypothetical protein